MIPDGEAVVSTYLRAHPDVEALGARVAGRTPSSISRPWVRLTQLDATNDPTVRPEHIINFMFQLDCYAGSDHDTAQAEASLLGRTVRDVLDRMPEEYQGPETISKVRFVSMPRTPDVGLEPARERVILTATVWMHA